ncbi:hypothetical protein D1BOALGB6SA_2472, partial [Olavius sp. associated proteobacterium Delta 1]
GLAGLGADAGHTTQSIVCVGQRIVVPGAVHGMHRTVGIVGLLESWGTVNKLSKILAGFYNNGDLWSRGRCALILLEHCAMLFWGNESVLRQQRLSGEWRVQPLPLPKFCSRPASKSTQSTTSRISGFQSRGDRHRGTHS